MKAAARVHLVGSTSPRAPARGKAGAPIPTDEPLWTQQEAADFVRVAVSTLRACDCPKRVILLPGRRRPIVRYVPAEVRAWLEARSTTRGWQG